MQFRDLRAQYRELKNEIDMAIQEVLESSAYIMGKPVGQLEERLADYVGRKYCVSCASGTDALQLALMSLDIGVGDAVFTSDFTYFASAGAASVLGATPVLVDIDLATFNMDPADLERKINMVVQEGKLTPKAVIPVDLFGLPADFDQILPIASKYKVKVIEDAAQGFGGMIGDRRACSFGDLSAVSFFPAKPLGCYGDGGAVFTDDLSLCERLKSLRAHGKSPLDKYDNREIGINSRLDTLQAAILKVKLDAFERYELDDVNRASSWYTERLKDAFVTPSVPDGMLCAWAQYTVLVDNEEKRDRIKDKLKEHDIPSMIYYPRGLHRQGAYSNMGLTDDMYPNTVEATKRVLSLPIHPYLMEKDVDRVCSIMLAQ